VQQITVVYLPKVSDKKLIIIAPLSILSEDEWGNIECLYKAYQSSITDGCLFRDTGVDE